MNKESTYQMDDENGFENQNMQDIISFDSPLAPHLDPYSLLYLQKYNDFNIDYQKPNNNNENEHENEANLNSPISNHNTITISPNLSNNTFYISNTPPNLSNDNICFDTLNAICPSNIENKDSFLLNKKRSQSNKGNSPRRKKLKLFWKNNKKEVERIEINLPKKYGRRKLGEKGERNHNKNSKDNIMRTIKVHFRKYIYSIIKSYYKGVEKMKKIDNNFNENLKKDYNIKLYNTTLKDIFINTKLSKKYKHYPKDSNKNLINKIYEENKETSLIKILNLKYGEVFEIYIRKIKNEELSSELREKIEGTNILENEELKDIDWLIQEKEKKLIENNDKEKIEEYKKEIINLCLDFKGWFDRKIGRKRVKKKTNEQ